MTKNPVDQPYGVVPGHLQTAPPGCDVPLIGLELAMEGKYCCREHPNCSERPRVHIGSGTSAGSVIFGDRVGRNESRNS